MYKLKNVFLVGLLSSIIPSLLQAEITLNILGNTLSETAHTSLGKSIEINVENITHDVDVHVAVETPQREVILLTEEGIDAAGKEKIQIQVQIPQTIEFVGSYKILAVTTLKGIANPANPIHWQSKLVQKTLFINRK